MPRDERDFDRTSAPDNRHRAVRYLFDRCVATVQHNPGATRIRDRRLIEIMSVEPTIDLTQIDRLPDDRVYAAGERRPEQRRGNPGHGIARPDDRTTEQASSSRSGTRERGDDDFLHEVRWLVERRIACRQLHRSREGHVLPVEQNMQFRLLPFIRLGRLPFVRLGILRFVRLRLLDGRCKLVLLEPYANERSRIRTRRIGRIRLPINPKRLRPRHKTCGTAGKELMRGVVRRTLGGVSGAAHGQ